MLRAIYTGTNTYLLFSSFFHYKISMNFLFSFILYTRFYLLIVAHSPFCSNINDHKKILLLCGTSKILFEFVSGKIKDEKICSLKIIKSQFVDVDETEDKKKETDKTSMSNSNCHSRIVVQQISFLF